jgi:hypothetical protein
MLLVSARQLQTAPPPWWQRSGAVDTTVSPSDYAVLTVGQLKSLATAAAAEMNAIVPLIPHGGAGTVIQARINGWRATSASGQGNDYAAATVGQLKTVAREFYDRLGDLNFSLPYPWRAPTAADNDYALATVGQAKTVFAFDLDRDSDGDGISDFDEGIAGGTRGQSHQQRRSPHSRGHHSRLSRHRFRQRWRTRRGGGEKWHRLAEPRYRRRRRER